LLRKLQKNSRGYLFRHPVHILVAGLLWTEPDRQCTSPWNRINYRSTRRVAYQPLWSTLTIMWFTRGRLLCH